VLFSCKKETVNNYYYNGRDTVTVRDTITVAPPPVVDPAARKLDSGLVAYYPFSGNTGDSSTFKNHGTGSNITLTADHFGIANKAYSFNGASSYVRIPHSESLDLASEYSISCWVKPDTNVVSYGTQSFLVFYGDEIAGQDPYFFSYDLVRKSINMGQFIGSGSDFNVLSMPLTNQFKNVWIHATTTFNNATRTISLYLNGTKVASQQFASTSRNYPTNNSSYETFLGSACGKWSLFKGALDEVRIYNRELTATEADALYRLR
jgi:hypothetical protein